MHSRSILCSQILFPTLFFLHSNDSFFHLWSYSKLHWYTHHPSVHYESWSQIFPPDYTILVDVPFFIYGSTYHWGLEKQKSSIQCLKWGLFLFAGTFFQDKPCPLLFRNDEVYKVLTWNISPVRCSPEGCLLKRKE